ncbi:hypothetical protein D8M04_03865 [Oceanobacillus piezotolerans]|uniref:DUF3139 domain-containing protein n=1 Tax=Oceanobacillus piezotolerans TaxID=2448030 RepID=A0A498DU74_9BACI|nr:hypothetical protein [Oceanobacillus piezotolerans]RLL48407.1 hypothetical protein D8M04_03865 [Oceanobacillus piezotolerans]
MNRLKLVLLTAICTIILMLLVSLFSPYNILKKITEDSIINDPGISILFNKDEIEDINYRGSNTYIITTSKKDYIAVQEYYSMMNYKWFVYEKADEWG